MNSIVKLSAAVAFGILSGAMIGTILGSFYLTFALKLGVANFDMLGVWKHSGVTRSLHQDAFKVAFGSVGLFALGLGILAFIWTYKKQRDDYGSAHWQGKSELKRNQMLRPVGQGFVCGKLGDPKSSAAFISSQDVPHVMMVAPTRAGKGVGFVIPNILAFGGSAIILDVKGENFEKTSRYRVHNGDEVYRFSPFDWTNGTHRYNPLARIAKAKTFAEQFTEVSILADLFLDKDNRQADTFTEMGKSIFVSACLLAIERGKPTLGEACAIVSAGSDKKAQYLAYSVEAKNDHLKLQWTNAASASDRLLTSNTNGI